MMNHPEKIIMGIDPGTLAMGYGLIKIHQKNIDLICLGTIKLNKYANQALKLKAIYDKINVLIENYHPDECAIEAPFFGKNVQSMLKLGRAQGVCMLAALNKDIPVSEYAPKKIKMAITGNGNASKEQVAAMLKTLCAFKKNPKYLDATDGLAAAVCHHLQSSSNPYMRKANGEIRQKNNTWNDFIKSHPKRIR